MVLYFLLPQVFPDSPHLPTQLCFLCLLRKRKKTNETKLKRQKCQTMTTATKANTKQPPMKSIFVLILNMRPVLGLFLKKTYFPSPSRNQLQIASSLIRAGLCAHFFFTVLRFLSDLTFCRSSSCCSFCELIWASTFLCLEDAVSLESSTPLLLHLFSLLLVPKLWGRRGLDKDIQFETERFTVCMLSSCGFCVN